MTKKVLIESVSNYRNRFVLGLLLLLISTAAMAQNVLKGQVFGPLGETLPGASIVVEGTSIGSVTDYDGNFSIDLPEGAENINVSFIGYTTQKLAIGNQSVIKITLQEDTETLEEIVIVGYGTQKKTDVTGAIVGVEGKDLVARGTTNPLQALQGAITGVQVKNTTGRVGDSFSVAVRGGGLGGNRPPLYVVDGVVVDDIDFLNPQDIAKLDVLKDASAAAIYGSRAAFGVVLIQTKGGASVASGTTVSFDTFYGFKNPARLPEMMDAATWQEYHIGAYMATTSDEDLATMTPQEFYDGKVASPTSNQVLRNRFEALDDFDWYDAVLEPGMQSNNYVSVAHRNGASSYTIGAGYQKETGNIVNEEMEKFTLRSNINQQINDKLRLGVNFTVAKTEKQKGAASAMQQAFRLNPYLSPWAIDEDLNEIEGELYTNPGKLLDPNDPTGKAYVINKTSTYNPLLQMANSSDLQSQWNVLSNMFLEYKPKEWLILKTSFSGGLKTYNRGKSSGVLTQEASKNGNLAMSSMESYENFNYSWDNQFNLVKEFDKHNFNFMGLQSIYSKEITRSYMASSQQPFETGFSNVGSGLPSSYVLINPDSDAPGYSKNTLASFAARLNYGYDDRYLITLTNRWDGASQLSEDNKWNSFPSVAVAWRLSNESFMEGISVLDDLKLRVGYGVTGYQNVDPYSTVNTLSQPRYYDFNSSVVNGWMNPDLANNELTWQRNKEFNLGVDFSIMDRRVRGSVDVYDKLMTQFLLNSDLPLETGVEKIKANNAEVRNKGFEVGLTTTNVQNDLITWETTFTYSKNINTIESLYGQTENDDVGNNYFIGENSKSYNNYVFDGIWQKDEAELAALYNQEEGQAKVKDFDNNGVIDPNVDRAVLGNPDPDWTGGIISRLTVGDFDFNFTVSAVQGVLVYSQFHQNFEDVRDRGRQKLNIDSWYIPENTVGVPAQASNTYPQPRNAGQYWRSTGSDDPGVGYYKDASYVKVNNISLGYTLPQGALDRLKLQYLRVYVNVLNPFVFTDYTGYDPEWAEADFSDGRVSNITTQLGLSLKF
ncbi:MAG: SusC/RagA family TonB-linked outer membrane protein [Reichenbachiella sp.]